MGSLESHAPGASLSSCALALFPQENHKLRDQNDDLNGQILSLSLYEAKNLFATQTKAQSLAAEIDTASRDEVSFPFIPAHIGVWSPFSGSCP